MNYKIKVSSIILNVYKEKLRLIQKAKTKGLYENFGQKEVSKFSNKYIDISDYSIDMNRKREAIQEFNSRCMNYCG